MSLDRDDVRMVQGLALRNRILQVSPDDGGRVVISPSFTDLRDSYIRQGATPLNGLNMAIEAFIPDKSLEEMTLMHIYVMGMLERQDPEFHATVTAALEERMRNMPREVSDRMDKKYKDGRGIVRLVRDEYDHT